MKLSACVAMAFLSLFMVSCTKENSFSNEPDPTLTSNSEIPRLTRLYTLDTTRAIPYDTVSRYSYFYDPSNRLSKLISFTIEANGDSSSYSVDDYFYTGNDTLANMTIRKSRFFSGGIGSPFKDTVFYAHNASGKQTKDSARASVTNYYTADYVYLSPSYITGTNFRRFSSTNFYKGTNNYHPVRVNGNIVSQKDTGSTIPSVSITDTTYFAYNRTATYNTHPDPLSRVYSCIRKDFLNTYPGLGNLSCAANLLVSQDDISTTYGNLQPVTPYENSHVDYTYVYRADGYPLIARERLVLSGTGTTYTKILFFY